MRFAHSKKFPSRAIGVQKISSRAFGALCFFGREILWRGIFFFVKETRGGNWGEFAKCLTSKEGNRIYYMLALPPFPFFGSIFSLWFKASREIALCCRGRSFFDPFGDFDDVHAPGGHGVTIWCVVNKILCTGVLFWPLLTFWWLWWCTRPTGARCNSVMCSGCWRIRYFV